MSEDETTCEVFDTHAEDLALGHVEAPRRGSLLAHAATCPRCQSLLDDLVTVSGRLLLTTPEFEPPAGFESRVLARIDEPTTAPSRGRRRWLLATAAAVLVAVSAGVAVVAVRLAEDDSAGRHAEILTTSGDVEGTVVGAVVLVAEPTPHVLVTIDAPRPAPGARTCELQASDGTWHTVGSWDAGDIYSGVWAAGIDADLLDATAMRITADGAVLATARFA